MVATPSPINVLLIMDLSDRVKEPGEEGRDLAVVRMVADAFRERCRRVGYPFSRDRLRFQGVRTTVSRSDITVDVGLINDTGEPVVTQIVPRLDRFVNLVSAEYREQFAFVGADLWGYLKDDFGALLRPAPSVNKIVLVTDGYLNFDAKMQLGRPANTSMQVGKLRSMANWKEQFPQYALRGIGRTFDRRFTQILILEIAPKLQPNSVNEMDILKMYWSTFCDSIGIECGNPQERILSNKVPASELKDRLDTFLNN